MTSTTDSLPPRPQPPEGYDCCGGGCADCDLRRYHQDLVQWLKLKAEHDARNEVSSDAETNAQSSN